ncbi:MAG: glycosyltransferase [Nitrospirae bacterium]|nr:glycosyltransferase [Nitrospirota bacterium]
MISVIIPTRNAEGHIHRLLDSLKKQSVPSETIVIDSSSSDNTVSIAESLGAKTKIIVRGLFGHGKTRNLGVNLASGDIIIFLTQDALPADEHFLKNLIKPLDNPEIAAAYGRQIPKADAKPTEKFSRFFNYPDTPLIKDSSAFSRLGIKTFFFSNVCSAIRRKEFEELRGFSENLIMNEDMLFACRLIKSGYKIAYVPEASVIHSHNYSLRQQFRRYFDIGVFLRKNLETLNYVDPNNVGVRFLREEIRYLMKNGYYRWCPYLAGESISKFIGYKLGRHYDLLPLSIRRRISMHSNYWNE